MVFATGAISIWRALRYESKPCELDAEETNMDVPIVMPQLGNEIEEAQIDAWLKAVGDRVTAGEPVLTVTTPKLTMEIEAPTTGVLKEISARADEIAPVGATLGVISDA
jgi:pyruvate/2-oxoglutarate dehydrogenase complex dihydrolipoamide acyltransferase (E2) component